MSRNNYVNCRSHAEKQTGLEPQVHLGPTVMAMERQGIQTERGNEHREIAAHNEAVLAFHAAEVALMAEVSEQARWRAEKEKLREMSFEQLQKERERYKPQSLDTLIAQDPMVSVAEAEANRLKSEYQALEKGLGDNRYDARRNEAEMGRYREQHPWKARLHDFHLMPDQELTARQEAEAAFNAERVQMEKALEKSQRENMQAVQALGDVRNQAMPGALRVHERQVEYFQEVEGIYQPLKEQQIAREQARRREQEQQREKERQQERERGGGRYMGR